MSALVMGMFLLAAFVPYNTTFNASGGLYQMMNATSASMNSVLPIMGGNMLAISFLIPAWLIIFISLSKFNMNAGFVAACFICTILSTFMWVLALANESVIIIFAFLTVGSTLMYYYNTRN